MSLLDVHQLTMRFGGLTAVKELDCHVDAGEIFSIIGPNGAGKTTVFNAITGIYEPSEGTIRFQGHELKRPFTWRVVAACLVIGIITGLAALLAMVDVDALWRATINRNMADPNTSFSYAAAWRDLQGYLRGDLAVRRERNGRWSIIPPWAKTGPVLDQAATRSEAEHRLAPVQEAIERAAAGAEPVERDGAWVLPSADAGRVLLTFSSADVARNKLAQLAETAGEQRAMPWTAAVSLAAGIVLGAAGTWAIWRRSRRTPDVVALGGVARTFQNIRLFQNMTVVENVLVGMDRTLRVGLLRMILRTPGVRARERAAVERAQELLTFIGLQGQGDLLAKQLSYGDQRRLEIARALATNPKLLLLDEPAAGMNPSEAGGLMELIRRIRGQGITVGLIEHHMKVVMGISDRIAVLDYGVKIAEGKPDEVRADPKVIEAYLGKESAG